VFAHAGFSRYGSILPQAVRARPRFSTFRRATAAASIQAGLVPTAGSGLKAQVEDHTQAQRRPPKSRDLSQLSHGLDGRYWTVVSIPDIRQDADLLFWISEHWPDTFH
jgi:hypothetical protein